MKFTMGLLTIAFTALNTFAAPTVLMESVTNVGFAPPDKVGKYSTQILSDGAIQTVDNKNKVIKVATLAPAAVKNLVAKMKAFQIGPMEGENGPACFDAPSSAVIVYRDGQAITVKSRVACQETKMYEAAEMYGVMDSVTFLSETLTH